MLNREDWLMIREMREKGCYLREIAERAGCSERTVRQALKRGRRPRNHPAQLHRPPLSGNKLGVAVVPQVAV